MDTIQLANLQLDDEFTAWEKTQRDVAKITKSVEKEISRMSENMAADDQFNHGVITQLYLIEIMIHNMKQEIYFNLSGKYRDEIVNEMKRLSSLIRDTNEKWEDYRKTFF